MVSSVVTAVVVVDVSSVVTAVVVVSSLVTAVGDGGECLVFSSRLHLERTGPSPWESPGGFSVKMAEVRPAADREVNPARTNRRAADASAEVRESQRPQ